MKKIKVEVIKVAGFDKGLIRVLEQTERGADFGMYDNTFTASNGVKLVSNRKPARDADRAFDKSAANTVYLRGSDRTQDNNAIAIPVGRLDKVLAAIEEYNRVFRFWQKPVYHAVPAPRPVAAPAACSYVIG